MMQIFYMHTKSKIDFIKSGKYDYGYKNIPNLITKANVHILNCPKANPVRMIRRNSTNIQPKGVK